MEFFDFKIMNEKIQKEHKLPAKRSQNNSQIDSIKKYLRSSHYDKLKTYIVKNVIQSMDENELSELTIKPLRVEIKTEMIEEMCTDVNFIDPNIIMKIEKPEENADENDVNPKYSDSEETVSDASGPDYECKTTKNDEQSSDEDESNQGKDILFDEKPENEDEIGVTKTMIDNIQFISKIPESLVRIESKKKEIEESGSSRVPQPEKWRQVMQKKARAKGESYVSRYGKVIRARQIQPPCNCKFQCTSRISDSDRRRNFDNHWSLADFALQKKFLFEHRKTEPIARRRARVKNPKPRQYSSKFYLDTYNEDGSFKSQERVCETMFCATFDICKNNLRTLHQKIITGKVQDMRGQSRRALSPGHLVAIDLVKQFPHFHIDQQMTVRQMYNNYVQECEKKGVTNVRENTFRKIFSDYNETEFLKKDKKKSKCITCVNFFKVSEEEKATMQFDFDQHIRNSEHCKIRLRWRKNRDARKERQQLLKEQKLFEEQQSKTKVTEAYDQLI